MTFSPNSFSLFPDFYVFFIIGEFKCHLTVALANDRFKNAYFSICTTTFSFEVLHSNFSVSARSFVPWEIFFKRKWAIRSINSSTEVCCALKKKRWCIRELGQHCYLVIRIRNWHFWLIFYSSACIGAEWKKPDIYQYLCIIIIIITLIVAVVILVST